MEYKTELRTIDGVTHKVKVYPLIDEDYTQTTRSSQKVPVEDEYEQATDLMEGWR